MAMFNMKYPTGQKTLHRREQSEFELQIFSHSLPAAITFNTGAVFPTLPSGRVHMDMSMVTGIQMFCESKLILKDSRLRTGRWILPFLLRLPRLTTTSRL